MPPTSDSRPGTDGTLLSRYECKYLVTEDMAADIRTFTAPFVQPDPFAARWPDHRYDICSLYLDTHDLRLYRTTVEGHKNRFKLRIRTYSDDPQTPAFLEIKRRVDQVIVKRRARVPRSVVPDIVAGRIASETMHDPDAAEFLNTSMIFQAHPCLRVRYKREAYESRNLDPVRINFDTDLQHCITPELDLSHQGPGWDTTPVPGVILEVKFTEVFPSWVRELIDRFELAKQSVAKYVLSINEAVASGRYETHVPISQNRAARELRVHRGGWEHLSEVGEG